ncbi:MULTISPECIES: LysR substrate-binding domain-containing protein [Pseudoalteromonas]|uniref:LysR substrate-binding domain-containing protein n=1 Tax=Pseudoalteromonas distincta TaxID=77608 RepID=A0ABT9GFN0_9GAMM|nr:MULTISPECIES: LysR substrate-binding domain-containing protein [Pseudoalteromonas]KHM49580.1 LysR family transcriptional regulator [Pseudoalteromonas elyakovii]KID38691.1 LysR family transcriptional regulator [Pseudoalteromonas distincta]MBH0069329.1 LysR family transcriptional regulator [Pseudoalteromonas sp. NZS100]MDC3210975.1 LysR substrate-binding domain-containing protein [Pseudoalteromonas distincta]MDP4484394.1 LysR substrate-binding domain-containing protein [Pseudoalteromonas elya|tara:strand:+ start:2054 stop:2980 length:927 start_codon:yes stop_codon:yes gene_type:complete
MKINPLPPLNSLVAFEASARHSSFTIAAKELNVTQGAISRQIRQLEEYLGKAIFIRASRSIHLTPTGLQYYQAISRSLVDISDITGQVKKWQGDKKITVATTNAMASLWLLPKVAEFQNLHDDIDLRILASDNEVDLNRLECDLALFYCRTQPANMNITTLFCEEVFPVCSPSYLEKIGSPTKPEDIFTKTILHLDETQMGWVNWEEWFAGVGLEQLEPRNRININNYPMLLQASINGQGIALAWGSLVDEYLQSGVLIRPTEHVLTTGSKFSMIEPNNRGRMPTSVKHFREWLLQQIPDEVGERGLV